MRTFSIAAVASLSMLGVTASRAPAQASPTLVSDTERVRRDEPARSTIEHLRIRSAILGQTRRIDVALPPSYRRTGTGRRYPVAVVFDAESNFFTTVTVADRLAGNGQIPETIVVGIENVGTERARVHDLTPPGLSVSGSDLHQGGDAFLDFIERELLPAVDKQFRGGAPRILLGHSSGGVLATYAAATRPMFRAVVAIDAPVALGHGWLMSKLISHARQAAVVPLRFAAYEARYPISDSLWGALTAAAPPSWLVHRDSLRLESHETIYMLGAYLGLREIFRDYSQVTARSRLAEQILPYYSDVDASLGAHVAPPRVVLANLVEDLVSEGRGATAREAYDLLANGYGPPVNAQVLLAEISAAERQERPAGTVEALLAAPLPTPDAIRSFLGEWRGSIWMSPDEPRRGNITFRVRVENGRVVAETRNADAPPELAGWRKVDYLAVTGNGLTWGRLNGMRPRGVMLWEGALRGDTLAGPGHWGGVSVESPRDWRPGFSFIRVKE